MKTLAASVLIALSGLLGSAAYAAAAPASQTVVVAHLGNDAHGHNYEQPKNTDAVTNQGPNTTTPALRDAVDAALGSH